MGTNYYWQSKACDKCGHSSERIHIGKSSAGWCFGLHVTDELTTLGQWEAKWNSGGYIYNEYDKQVSVSDMMKAITERSGLIGFDDRDWPMMGYYDEADFHNRNHSERGPNNLLRHRIDGGHCVGHGDGTWDYIASEFS